MKTKPAIDEKTHQLRRASRVIIVATALLWALYDLLPFANAGKGDTLSENIRDWSRSIWAIPFVFGALSTHFFFNLGVPERQNMLLFVMLGICGMVIAGNIATYFIAGEVPVYVRASALIIGMICGALFWRQDA